MYKLLMTWNVRKGKETAYLSFLTHDFTKAILEMGIQPTDAWYAVWGHRPQVLAGGVTDDLETMEQALESEEWTRFVADIQELVTDFDHKIVKAAGGFQL